MQGWGGGFRVGGRGKLTLRALKFDTEELLEDERGQQTPPLSFFINKWAA